MQAKLKYLFPIVTRDPIVAETPIDAGAILANGKPKNWPVNGQMLAHRLSPPAIVDGSTQVKVHVIWAIHVRLESFLLLFFVVLDADRSTGETNLMRTTIGRKSHDLSQHTGTLNYCRISYRSVA